MNAKNIQDELQLNDDEGCIIFDFGCYFPYLNTDILIFKFELGMEQITDIKQNHRYINRHYQTLTKTYGRKISKFGYPYIFKLDQQTPIVLALTIGITGVQDKTFQLIFPIETNLTKEKPICKLSLRYHFNDSEFYFQSYECLENGTWQQHIWSNYKKCNDISEFIQFANPIQSSVDPHICYYNEIIKPCPSTLDNMH